MISRSRTIDFGEPADALAHRNRWQRRLLAVDFYRSPFKLMLPDETDRYRTFLGATMSILTVFLLIIYSVYKLNTMIGF